MKILKIIVIIFLLVLVFSLIVALFVKKDYHVKREIVINKPKKMVFDYIRFLRNQEHYSKWTMMDPHMKVTYKGTDGTVGFVTTWESADEKLGQGEQEILAIKEGEIIETRVRFKVPFENESDAYLMTTAISENETKVTWGFMGSFPYPINLMASFINMDKTVGSDLEDGLKLLKKVLEKQ